MSGTTYKAGGEQIHRDKPQVAEEPSEPDYTDDGGSLGIDVDMGKVKEACKNMERRFETAKQDQDPVETEHEGLKGEMHKMGQMGAKRIGSLAIGIAVVGLVLNQMSDLSVFNDSSGVIDVNSIFQTAGSGLQLLVVGVIIAAAAVILNIWSGF